MPNYLHNDRNLRIDLDVPNYHRTFLPGQMEFIIAEFEDRAGADWDGEWKHRKFYAGVKMKDETLEEALEKIMKTGAKPYDIYHFLHAEIGE